MLECAEDAEDVDEDDEESDEAGEIGDVSSTPVAAVSEPFWRLTFSLFFIFSL